MRITTRSAVLVASAAASSVDAFVPEASFGAASFGAGRRTACRSSYLDNLSSASSGGSMSSVVATAPPPAPPAVAAAPSHADAISEVCDADSPTPSEDCAVAITSYLDSLSTGESSPTMDAAAAISSYLDALSAGTSSVTGASSGPAVASYLDALSSRTVEPPSTGAISSYIDALSTREIMAPANADAITTYLGSLAACDGDNSKSEDCASAITSYLDTLGGDAGYSAAPPPPPPPPPATQSAAGGQQQQPQAAAGSSYLESLAACEGGAQRSEECATAITSYLDALSTGSAQPSSQAAATITSYLDALSAGAAAAAKPPPPPPRASPPSPVSETIEALPETKVSESVTSIAPLVMPYVEDEVSTEIATSPQVETYTGTTVQVFEDAAHVTKEPTTLRLMEKMWYYSAPGYSIRDQNGVEWFEYVSRSLSVRAHRQVRTPLHETIFFMKEKLFQWAPTQYRNPIYHKNDSIYQSLKVVGGRALGRAKLRSNVRDVNTGEIVKLVLEGDVVDFDATIYVGGDRNEGGQPVARIYRPLVNGRKVAFGGVHQYQVDIAPGIDAAMIVAMCISFDELKNDRDHGH